MRYIIFVLAFGLAPAVLLADDIDTLRFNVRNYLTAAGADSADPLVSQSLSDLSTQVRSYMNMALPRGGWPDITYNLNAAAVWSPIYHYVRMRTMAQAYQTRGQPLYHNDSLRLSIEKALDTVNDIFHPGTSLHLWFRCMGVPLYLGPTLFLMEGGLLDSAVYARALATLEWCLGTPASPIAWEGGPGGDDALHAMTQIYCGILTRDTVRLNKAYRKMSGELVVLQTPQNGIVADYSLYHHSTIYTGGYGVETALSGPQYSLFTRNTAYALPQAKLDVLTTYNAEGTMWGLYNNYYDISVIGRQITRPDQNGCFMRGGTWGLSALTLMGSITNPRQTDFQKGAKRMFQTWNFTVPIELAPYLSEVSHSPVQAAWPEGHKHYWTSYYTCHRRQDYFISLKMLGGGIWGSEQVNGEGKKTGHLMDGVTYVLRSGDEYYKTDAWPTMDWYRLPGITIQRKTYDPLADFTSNLPFVGGAACGPYGVSAMDFANSGEVAVARKSWFFFDDEMVCLGAGITCPSPDTTETVINQRPLSASNMPLIADGNVVSSALGWSGTMAGISWLACDSMGYFFPGRADVSGKMVNQSGRWTDLGSGNTAEPIDPTILHTNPMATFWINHGPNARKAAYAYAVLPNKSAQDMAVYAASPAFRIIANNDTLQAMEQTVLKAFTAVFWRPGACGLVKADSPSIVFSRKTSDSLYFSAVYPPRKQVDLRYTLDDALVLVSSSRAATVTTDSLITSLQFRSPGDGQGIYAVFKRIPKAFGYVRFTVRDSATSNLIPGALCTVQKIHANSASTDLSGIAVVRADTGTNQAAISRESWQSASSNPVQIRTGETTEVDILLPKLRYTGIRITPTALSVAMVDTARFKVLGIYPDGGADTLSNAFSWTLSPDGLAAIDSTGRVFSGSLAGTGTVQCSSAVLGYAATAGLAVCHRFQPTEDASVYYAASDSRDRGDSLLRIGSGGDNYGARALIKFDLSSIAGTEIDSAWLTIRHYISTPAVSPTGAQVYLYGLDTAWRESTVTGTTAPHAPGAPIDTMTIGYLEPESNWKTADLTAYVREKLADSPVFSFGMNRNYGGYVYFNSKESPLSSPFLMVALKNGSAVKADNKESLPFAVEIIPNPFNPVVSIRLSGFREKAVASIFEPTGRLVSTLALDKGLVKWDAGKMPSGLYLIEVRAGAQILRTKAILLK